MGFRLNQYGFIEQYLVSGVKLEDFSSDIMDDNQLLYEKKIREVIADHRQEIAVGEIKAGADSRLGCPWEYYYSYGNWFVDRSDFYPLVKKVEMDAVTILETQEKMEIALNIWSYGAVDLWLNGHYAGCIDRPVYKPIQKKTLYLELEAGQNQLYIRLQNLGVRDTRNLFGLQVEGSNRDRLQVLLPDWEHVSVLAEAGTWLSGLRIQEKEGEPSLLLTQSPAPCGSRIVYDTRPDDYTKYQERYCCQEIEGRQQVELNGDIPYLEVQVHIAGKTLGRKLEQQLAHKIRYVHSHSDEENERRVFERIAEVMEIPRMGDSSFSIFPILARYAVGKPDDKDGERLYRTLLQIESRMDCSDFMACGMLRFMKCYPVDAALSDRCREVFLNYRYWMDQDGADGMCFWSENHALLFFGCGYIAGELYPDEIFRRAKMTGLQLKEASARRLEDWLKEVLEHGFDEFNSGGYFAVTFAGLLNVIDFCDTKLSEMARQAADKLIEAVAVQTFHGVNLSPMGRVYREVLYPAEQEIQALIQLLDREAPDAFCEWFGALASSGYRLPREQIRNMKCELSVRYPQANGRIHVGKCEDYILTSVESPRTDGIIRVWENVREKPDADTGSFLYAKSWNECFHGTTQFEPGVFGYQQHMWVGALDADTCVFVNHPGVSCDSASMRPGYWFGNGIMPALRQCGNILYGIYRIPENHPIPFTHLYWPSVRMEEELVHAGWLAGRKAGGYIAVWCSEMLVPHDDHLCGCEYRAESRDCAYLCVCGSRKEYPSLKDFLENCEQLQPEYDRVTGCLRTKRGDITYVPHTNQTQYV